MTFGADIRCAECGAEADEQARGWRAMLAEEWEADGPREVPIPAVLRDVLLEHKVRSGRRDGLVFGRTASEPFTPSHVRRQAAEAWQAENETRAAEGRPALRPIGLHECRHTYVTLMFEAGVPLERIGDYVGHSSTYMTDRYRHLLDGHAAEAAAALDAYLAKAPGPRRAVPSNWAKGAGRQSGAPSGLPAS